MSEEFENLIVENREYKSKESPLSVIIAFAISAILIYIGVMLSSFYSMLPIGLGIGLIIGTFVRMDRSRKEAVPVSFWIDMIQNNPSNIVWIKPIDTQISIAAIPVLNSRKFILYTKDEYCLTLFCESDSALEIFVKGIKTYLPDAHLGYDTQIESLYDEDAENFLKFLKSRNLYTPVHSL